MDHRTKKKDNKKIGQESYVSNLFEDFNKGIFLQYLFSLMRVGSIESYKEDPFFLVFKKLIKNDRELNIDKEEVFWKFLLNIIFVARKGDYIPYIFTPNENNFREASKEILKKNPGKFSDLIDIYFPKSWEKLSEEQKERAVDFTKNIYIFYRKHLKKLSNYPRYIKLNSFDVVELIVNHRKRIVECFKIHFSNGSHALFERTDTGTMAINLDLSSNGVGVMIGMISEQKDEWMVGDKHLYEIGLPFRYNKLGEWKPLIFPGKSDDLQERARNLSNEDNRVAGALFYIFCTGHRVIEFAAKSQLKLPEEIISFYTGLHIYQIESNNKDNNEAILDGWIELDSIEPEDILVAIDIIEKTFSSLSFAFNSVIEWTLKYNISVQTPGTVVLEKKDFNYFNKILRGLRNDEDHYIISSIDWFERGISSRNPFNRYICFYLAIETLAIKLATGEMEKSKSFGISKQVKNDKEFKECVTKLHELYFDEKPRQFVDKAYFECLGTISQSLKVSLGAVFGKDSDEYKEFFEKKPTISDIRNRLIHEPYSRWSAEEQFGLNKKVALLSKITKDFILRVSFELDCDDDLPERSDSVHLGLYTDNPNTTLVASHLSLFPATDWKIKPSWINPRTY